MPIVIDETVEVAAPPETVWNVITDFPRYGEWNPFVVACESTLVVGDPIRMRVHVFEAFAQPQREVIFEHEPGKRFCYGIEGMGIEGMGIEGMGLAGMGLAGMQFGPIRSQRCHEVIALRSDRTAYRSRFELSGWLSPVVSALLGRQLQRGFDAMTQAVRSRSEQLDRESNR